REDDEGDEVEEGRPGDRGQRAQHPGRDHRGHRVGGVVQAVEEVERQGQQDQAPDKGGQLTGQEDLGVELQLQEVHVQDPLMTISETTCAVSLQASTVSSSQPYSSRSLISSRMSGGLANRPPSLSR